MRVLVACEYSGVVRDAFLAKGHDAYSCDLLESEGSNIRHYTDDVSYILGFDWDLMIAHPPCTFLTVAQSRWMYDPEDKHLPVAQRNPHPEYPNRKKDQDDTLEFVRMLMEAPIEKICIENPVGAISTNIRKPDQYIHPWEHGHGETKKTGLWLKNLPKLKPSNIVSGREQKIWKMGPGPNRWKDRSRTYTGIANAMADQWGKK